MLPLADLRFQAGFRQDALQHFAGSRSRIKNHLYPGVAADIPYAQERMEKARLHFRARRDQYRVFLNGGDRLRRMVNQHVDMIVAQVTVVQVVDERRRKTFLILQHKHHIGNLLFLDHIADAGNHVIIVPGERRQRHIRRGMQNLLCILHRRFILVVVDDAQCK